MVLNELWYPSNCFHSISFPSEWGPDKIALVQSCSLKVSIQLVSPASGDRKELNQVGDNLEFPFN